MAKKYALGKKDRLKSRKQIEQLFKEGRKISVFPFLVHFQAGVPTNGHPGKVSRDAPGRLRQMPPSIQIGVGVSGKFFKRAVDRNRIKRLIREAYRLQKQDLCDSVKANNRRLNLFFIYTARELPDYQLVYDRMAVALQKISTAIEK